MCKLSINQNKKRISLKKKSILHLIHSRQIMRNETTEKSNYFEKRVFEQWAQGEISNTVIANVQHFEPFLKFWKTNVMGNNEFKPTY